MSRIRLFSFLSAYEVDYADIFIDRVGFDGDADDAELRVQDDASVASVADSVIDEQAGDDFTGCVKAVGDVFSGDSPTAELPEAGAGFRSVRPSVSYPAGAGLVAGMRLRGN